MSEERPAVRRAQRLVAEHGLRMARHGRGAWRITGYCVDLLVSDRAIGMLTARDLVPQLIEAQPGETIPRPVAGR